MAIYPPYFPQLCELWMIFTVLQLPHLGSIEPHFSPFLPASIFQHVCSNWRFRPWTTNSQTRPAGSPLSVSSCGSLDNLRWAMISPLVKPVGGQRWPGGQGGWGGWGWRLGGMEHQDMDVFWNDEPVDFLNMFSQHFQTPIYWTETI